MRKIKDAAYVVSVLTAIGIVPAVAVTALMIIPIKIIQYIASLAF